jgi:hypothetical protein
VINREEDRRAARIDRTARISTARRAAASRLAREWEHREEAFRDAEAVADRFLCANERRMRREARVEAELTLMAAENGPVSIQGFIGRIADKIGAGIKGPTRTKAEFSELVAAEVRRAG